MSVEWTQKFELVGVEVKDAHIDGLDIELEVELSNGVDVDEEKDSELRRFLLDCMRDTSKTSVDL